MRKYHTVLHEVASPRRRRSRLPLFVGLALAALVAPVVYEAGLTVYAQWSTLAGTYWVPKTPLLDALRDWSQGTNAEFRLRAHRWVNSGPWSPSLAVPLAIGWAAAMAVVFLRKVR
jgi:peptidoglycan/LPS O-acetylase OafA/YrhL